MIASYRVPQATPAHRSCYSSRRGGAAHGLFTDPWQWFVHLDFEKPRAVRLGVDTGLQRQELEPGTPIAFVTDNTSMAAKDIGVEIDRGPAHE